MRAVGRRSLLLMGPPLSVRIGSKTSADGGISATEGPPLCSPWLGFLELDGGREEGR